MKSAPTLFDASCVLSDTRPTLIATLFPTEDVVVADVVATDFGCDPTGKIDSTAALQAAIDACRAAGGGVVFLPAGDYLITSKITVPHGVLLRGDWQDPEQVGAGEATYGTVILAKPAPIASDAPFDEGVLFRMSSNSGAMGLTVYYPEQDIANVIPYGYVFGMGAACTVTLRNLTLINAYRGICISEKVEWHELMKLEQLRITALQNAFQFHYSADVDYMYGMHFTPDYWAGAGRGFACADAAALKRYCRQHTVGMILGDLDADALADVVIRGCQTGLLFKAYRRSGFWGVFYDIDIRDCDFGIDVQQVCGANPPMFARGKIEGSVKCVRNPFRRIPLRFCDVELVGEVDSRTIIEEEDLSAYPLTHGVCQKPAAILYVPPIAALSGTEVDIADILQECLNKAATSGGVVRLPAGVYTLMKPITVPSGVWLTGLLPITLRNAANLPDCGTTLISYVRDGATVTLSEKAGMSGFLMWFPQFDVKTAHEMLSAGHPTVQTNAAVRGAGADVYVGEITANACFTAVDVRGCDSHLVRNIYGCAYLSLVRCGGKGGVVEECLANPNFLNRQALGKYFFHITDAVRERWSELLTPVEIDGKRKHEIGHPTFDFLCRKVTNQYCDVFDVVNAENQTVHFGFMYSPRVLIKCTDSKNVLMLNNVVDVLLGSNPMFDMYRSTARAVCALRVFGASVHNEGSVFDINCRNEHRNAMEKPYHSAVSVEDLPETVNPTEFLPLLGCDSADGVESPLSLTDGAAFGKEGRVFAGRVQFHTHTPVLIYRFAPKDISSLFEGGYIRLRMYCSDISTTGEGQIELTSSGESDVEELNWSTNTVFLKNGWNEAYLPLDSGFPWGGDLDPTRVNFFRMYLRSADCDIAIDEVHICR